MRSLAVCPCSCRTGAEDGRTTGSGSCHARTRRIVGTARNGSCCTGTRCGRAANSSSCHAGMGCSTSGADSGLRTGAGIRGCFLNGGSRLGNHAPVPLHRADSRAAGTPACRTARIASPAKLTTARNIVIPFSGCGSCTPAIAKASTTGTSSEAASTGTASEVATTRAASETAATNRSFCRPGVCARSCCTGLRIDCTPDIAGGTACTGRDGAVSAVPCCGGPIALAGIAAHCGRDRGRRA